MQITSKYFSTHAYKGTNIIQLFARYSEICFIYHKRKELFHKYILIRQKMDFKSLCLCLFLLINIHECINDK